MARTALEDALTVFRFKAVIDNFVRFNFSEISGMKKNADIMEIREGGWNESVRKSPGLQKYDNITFKRGQIISQGAVGGDDDFQLWLNQVHSATKFGSDNDFRRSIEVQQYANTGALAVRWEIAEAFPAVDMPFGDLNATTSEHAFEGFEVAHEGYRRLAV